VQQNFEPLIRLNLEGRQGILGVNPIAKL